MILPTTLILMNKHFYPPERVSICSHHLIIHAKVASTSLRGCGAYVDPSDAWDRPTIALIREPLQRWVAGYFMYLYELAKWSDGHPRFRSPRHFVYDVHTTQQAYKVHKDTHLIRFEDIQQYADRCQFNLPHLHNMKRAYIKSQLIQWLKDNPTFKHQLKHHLRLDYQLRDRCQSVQSLPDSLFTD